MTFEPKHDVGRLGPLKAEPADEAAPSGVLRSLADLVEWVGYRDDLPRRPAAAAVVNELARVAAPLYLTNCGTWATRLPAEYVWRQAVEERAGGVSRKVVPRGANWINDWGSLGNGSRFDERRTVVKPRAASPGAYGDPGALQVLLDAWCHDDVATRDKAMKAHGAMLERLAIPRRVAVESFGFPDAEGAGAGATRVAPGAADAVSIVGGLKLPQNTTEGNRALFEEWEVAGGKHGGSPCLAARYGVTERTIQGRIRLCRDTFESVAESAKRRAKGKAGRVGRAKDSKPKWFSTLKTANDSQ